MDAMYSSPQLKHACGTRVFRIKRYVTKLFTHHQTKFLLIIGPKTYSSLDRSPTYHWTKLLLITGPNSYSLLNQSPTRHWTKVLLVTEPKSYLSPYYMMYRCKIKHIIYISTSIIITRHEFLLNLKLIIIVVNMKPQQMVPLNQVNLNISRHNHHNHTVSQ